MGADIGCFNIEHKSHPPSISLGELIMPKRHHLVHGLLFVATLAAAAGAEKIPYAKSNIVPPTPEWSALAEKSAPAKPTVEAPKRKLLVFSLFTDYEHKVIPYVDLIFQILGKKSGAFEAHITTDIEMLAPEKLGAYDVLVLNNNCSGGERRNLFLDELETAAKYRDMTTPEREAKAAALEKSMLDFVAGGKGLVVMHGGPTMLNHSPAFIGMVGGAFDYHPPNQAVTVRTVDENHPLVAAFRGRGPFIHRDEPYCFKGAYSKLNFRPLLSMDVKDLKGTDSRINDIVRYVAWIKPHGAGRVFYCSPSHFPESYLSPTLLQFILDGTQYAAGDLKCDDSKPCDSKPCDH